MIVFFLQAAVIAAMPLLFGALGAIVNEKNGLLNLGVEGVMIIGAISSYLLAQATGSVPVALFGGMICGVLMNMIYGFLTITLKANQSVTGLTLATFGVGLANTLGRPYANVAIPANVINFFAPIKLPLLGDIPYVGPILFQQSILVYLAYILTIVLFALFSFSKWGLYINAVGNNPAAADSVSIDVVKMRYLALVISGAIIALGGEFLVLSYLKIWQPSITMGRGWIAVALVIFSAWRPLRAFAGALLFGGLMIIQFYFTLPISSYFIVMLPYVFTIITLVVLSTSKKENTKPPLALGNPYYRETR